MTVNAMNGSNALSFFNSLRDGLLVFAVLAIIALFSIGLQWEMQNLAVRAIDQQAGSVPQLDKAQIRRIQAIQITYDEELIRLKSGDNLFRDDDIDRLLKERDERILEVLNAKKQQMLYNPCEDVQTVSQTFNDDLMQ